MAAAVVVLVVGEEVDFGEGEGVVVDGGLRLSVVRVHELVVVVRRWAQVVEQIFLNFAWIHSGNEFSEQKAYFTVVEFCQWKLCSQ